MTMHRSRLWHPTAMRMAPALVAPKKSVGLQASNILLINPFYPKDPHASFGKHVLTPSLALTTLAASTPTDWSVQIWDENLLQGPIPTDPLPQIIGITVHLTFAHRAYEIAAFFRQFGCIVIFGGPHVTACPDESTQHADIIVIGDGSPLWPQILQDIRHQQFHARYKADFVSDLDSFPFPRRDLLPSASFLTTCSINATRGCHNRCTFCHLSTEGIRIPYQTRNPKCVATEILASGESYVVFTDNNLGADPDYLLRLCEELRTLGIIWSAAISVDAVSSPVLVHAMARAGCTGVFIGFESLSNQNLQLARKRTSKTSEYANYVHLLHEHGIQVNGSFVFGFDHDGPDVFARTADWIEAHRLECATFHILTPYPNTPLFRNMEQEDRLLHKDWSLYDTAHCVFRPHRMTPEQLEAGYDWIYRRIFSLGSIWRRRPMNKGSIPGYLAMSLLYKRANPLWVFLIRRRLIHTTWRPLVALSAWRKRRHAGKPSDRHHIGNT